MKSFDYLNFRDEVKVVHGYELVDKPPQEQMKLVAENYLDKLYRYVRYTFSLQWNIAEDIVHDLFLSLPQKINKFDTKRSFEPRLYRVTYNHTINRIKKHKNMKNKEENTLEEETFVQKIQNYDWNLSSEIEQTYKDALLKIVLSKLTKKSRELLLLYYFEYKNYEEIASIIKVKASGIWTMLSRAKKELQQHIESTPNLQNALIYDLN